MTSKKGSRTKDSYRGIYIQKLQNYNKLILYDNSFQLSPKCSSSEQYSLKISIHFFVWPLYNFGIQDFQGWVKITFLFRFENEREVHALGSSNWQPSLLRSVIQWHTSRPVTVPLMWKVSKRTNLRIYYTNISNCRTKNSYEKARASKRSISNFLNDNYLHWFSWKRSKLICIYGDWYILRRSTITPF